MSCIQKKNPAWGKDPTKANAEQVAIRLASIYDSASDRYHATSHAIQADKSMPISILGTMVEQSVNAITCIGDVLGLVIEVSQRPGEKKEVEAGGMKEEKKMVDGEGGGREEV